MVTNCVVIPVVLVSGTPYPVLHMCHNVTWWRNPAVNKYRRVLITAGRLLSTWWLTGRWLKLVGAGDFRLFSGAVSVLRCGAVSAVQCSVVPVTGVVNTVPDDAVIFFVVNPRWHLTGGSSHWTKNQREHVSRNRWKLIRWKLRNRCRKIVWKWDSSKSYVTYDICMSHGCRISYVTYKHVTDIRISSGCHMSLTHMHMSHVCFSYHTSVLRMSYESHTHVIRESYECPTSVWAPTIRIWKVCTSRTFHKK